MWASSCRNTTDRQKSVYGRFTVTHTHIYNVWVKLTLKLFTHRSSSQVLADPETTNMAEKTLSGGCGSWFTEMWVLVQSVHQPSDCYHGNTSDFTQYWDVQKRRSQWTFLKAPEELLQTAAQVCVCKQSSAWAVWWQEGCVSLVPFIWKFRIYKEETTNTHFCSLMWDNSLDAWNTTWTQASISTVEPVQELYLQHGATLETSSPSSWSFTRQSCQSLTWWRGRASACSHR